MTKEDFINFLLETEVPDNIETKEESKIVNEIFRQSWELTPENLYRYRCCNENNLNAIQENKFLLTKPTLFNDPYDSLLYINRLKIIEEITQHQEFDIVEKLKNDAKFKQEHIESFGEEFVESYSKFEPFKNSKEQEFYKKVADKIYTKFVDDLINLSLKSLKQSSLVACLSENFDSILMWSHYANNHTGFVLNYDFKSRFSIATGIPGVKATEFADKKILPIKYSNERFDATYYVEFHFIDNYFNKIGLKYKKPFFDKLFYYKILLFKSLEWSYEKEWRIIKQTNLNYQDNKPDIAFINNIIPKEIYLGAQISLENKDLLIEISKQKNIPIYQMEIETFNKEYKLTKREL